MLPVIASPSSALRQPLARAAATATAATAAARSFRPLLVPQHPPSSSSIALSEPTRSLLSSSSSSSSSSSATSFPLPRRSSSLPPPSLPAARGGRLSPASAPSPLLLPVRFPSLQRRAISFLAAAPQHCACAQTRSFATSTHPHQAVGAAVRKAPQPKAPRKAVLTLTPAAVARLRHLQIPSDPSTPPRLLKIGTRKKGCSGQTYTLDYVSDDPSGGGRSRLDEVVEQDGVKVLVDSKALFSLVGSEMDYVEDVLSSQFVFHNPNVKEMCGCGQSFMT